jgi:hypothetical protein
MNNKVILTILSRTLQKGISLKFQNSRGTLSERGRSCTQTDCECKVFAHRS